MRAVVVEEFGGPEVLSVREVPEPVADAGEVLVRVAAADVMYLDTRLRSGWGLDFFPLELPYVPGGAIAGTVIQVGPGVDPAWIGKRVSSRTAASGIGGGLPVGGYAELALAKVDTLVEVPQELSVNQAVALVHDGRTALAVFEHAAPKPGEWVLITAAGGGLGTLLIQFARAAGVRVVAAARGQEKLALAARLGADAVVDYSEDGWTDAVRAASGGAVHAVLDGAGGELGGAAATTLADGGRFLAYGSAAGDFAELDTEALTGRGVEVVDLFGISGAVEDWNALSRRAQEAVATGEIEVVIGQTFPLAEADRAHAAIEFRKSMGRTVLEL